MEYRREIDGLRAIAVLPVILFHAGFETFSGGFVGVDVFFVISGYLITSIILKEQATGTFSLVDFYERRARRILPALFFVMAACLPFSWLWLLPGELKSFAKSLVAVSTFSSNFLFVEESGYFEAAAELKPLLHTWSLAVEEQFYLLFPLLLLTTRKLGTKKNVAIIAAIGIVSLIAAELSVTNRPTGTFYLLPTRAWELMIGALAAFYLFDVKETKPNKLLSLLGFSLIIISVFSFDEKTPFPSIYALIPTLGTALIILFANDDSLLNRILSTKLLVGFGLISYSAYLWHHPVFAFAKHRTIEEPSSSLMATLIIISLGLAYVSWRFVERPFRDKNKFTRQQIFLLAGIASLFFILVGTLLYASKGAPERATKDNLTLGSIDKLLVANHGLSRTCESKFTLSEECTTSSTPKLILWGDSYAMHIAPALRKSPTKIGFRQHTVSSCIPIVGISIVGEIFPPSDAYRCIDHNKQVMAWLQEQTNVEYVVLSSPFEFTRFNLMTSDGSIRQANHVPYALEKLRSTVDTLRAAGFKPVIVSPPPNSGTDLGRCYAKAHLFDMSPERCNFELEGMSEASRQADQILSAMVSEAPVVFLKELICLDGECRTQIDEMPLYRDKGHLSVPGSSHLGQKADLMGLIVQKADAFWKTK